MRVAAAGREGGMGTSRERDGTLGGATADAAAGPPPRLLKSPPKVETLPAHIFSPVERGKIQRLRRFLDSLEIADEEPLSSTAAEAPPRADAAALANATEVTNDDSCWHDVIEEDPAGEATSTARAPSRSSSHPATHTSDTSGVETASSASDATSTGGSKVLPVSADPAAAPSKTAHAEGATPSSTSSWFSWNFLSAREVSAAAAASPTTEQKATPAGSGDSAAHVYVADAKSEKQKQQAQQEQEQEKELKLFWEEVLWLEDDLILARYLRSYGWDAEEARKQLLRTLLWRRQEKPQHVSPNQVASFARRGSVYRKGFDIYGRAVVYFKPGRDSSTGSHLFQRYVVYTIERALESLDREKGVDQLVFVVDFSEWGIMQIPRTEVSREIVTILNDHYTDVLAAAFIVNAPSYFDPIWRLVSLMVHPDTAKKVIFVHKTQGSCLQTPLGTESHSSRGDCNGSGSPEGDSTASGSTQGEETPVNVLRQLIPFPFLERCVGGESPLDYDHDVYWQAEKEQFLQQSIHRRQQRQALQHAVRRRRKLQQEQHCQDTPASGPPVLGGDIATAALL